MMYVINVSKTEYVRYINIDITRESLEIIQRALMFSIPYPPNNQDKDLLGVLHDHIKYILDNEELFL